MRRSRVNSFVKLSISISSTEYFKSLATLVCLALERPRPMLRPPYNTASAVGSRLTNYPRLMPNRNDQTSYFTAAWAKIIEKSLVEPEVLAWPDPQRALHNAGTFINLTKVCPLISTELGGVLL